MCDTPPPYENQKVSRHHCQYHLGRKTDPIWEEVELNGDLCESNDLGPPGDRSPPPPLTSPPWKGSQDQGQGGLSLWPAATCRRVGMGCPGRKLLLGPAYRITAQGTVQEPHFTPQAFLSFKVTLKKLFLFLFFFQSNS